MNDGDGGGMGCVSTILVCVLAWALLFGVTVSGKHYGLKDCSCARGVEIDK